MNIKMLTLFLLLLLSLVGCGFIGKINGKPEKANATATCEMNGFKGFPKSVTGPVVLEFKKVISIAILNKDETERVDMTFPKEKCKVVQ